MCCNPKTYFLCAKIVWVWILADWKCLCAVVYWRARGWDSRLIASFIFFVLGRCIFVRVRVQVPQRSSSGLRFWLPPVCCIIESVILLSLVFTVADDTVAFTLLAQIRVVCFSLLLHNCFQLDSHAPVTLWVMAVQCLNDHQQRRATLGCAAGIKPDVGLCASVLT